MADMTRHPSAAAPWWVRVCHWLWRQRSFVVGNILLGISLNIIAAWLISPWSVMVSNTPLGTVLDHPRFLAGGGLLLLALTGIVWRVNHLNPAYTAKGASIPAPSLRDRLALLQVLRRDYARRQSDALRGMPLLLLPLQDRTDATLSSAQLVFRRTATTEAHPLAPGTSLVQVYDDTADGLLLLGAPGTGKTTLLVELALDLLTRADGDSTHPLPVILNLSSWANKRLPLEDWLLDELQLAYRVPPRLSRTWLAQDHLLLLLDGLDEVAEPVRATCVAAINAYRGAHFVPLVVCSRTEDYLTQQARLTLPGAVEIRPLEEAQVLAYLQRAGKPLAAVRAVLRTNTTLRALVITPLIMSVVIQAYRDKAVKDLPQLGTAEDQQHQIFSNYIQRMLERPVVRGQFTPQQTRRWLTWLARQMQQQHLTEFYLERLQPTWLPTTRSRILYRVFSGLSFLGLATGLFGTLLGALLRGLNGGLIGALFFVLVGMLVGVLLSIKGGRVDQVIRPADMLKWSWKNAKPWLVIGPILGLAIGLIGGLAFKLPGGLIGGLVFALVLALALVLVGGLSGEQINEAIRIHPNQGIRSSGWIALVTGLVCLVVGAPAGALLRGPVVGLVVGLSFGLLGGLVFGGAAYLAHYALRFFLCRTGAIPWRYVRFLEEATERILLQRVGGGYRFIHPLFQEYFASGAVLSAPVVVQLPPP